MIQELIVFFTATIPFIELKLAIPLGYEFGMSTPSILLFAIPGTIIPPAIFLAIAIPVLNFLRPRFKFLDKFFEKLFSKTQKEHTKRFNRYGAMLLIAIVAIPIPGSGAGAGALIAFVFGLDYWKALSLIFLGTIINALLVTAGLNSIFAILDLFA